jgi:hypothetical protein
LREDVADADPRVYDRERDHAVAGHILTGDSFAA